MLHGMVFLDIIFSGLSRIPAGGEEIWADGMGSCPGGSANLAVASARLGLRTGLSAAFGDDAYGDFLWSTLQDQEGVDLSRSRRFEHWHTPVTVSVSHEGDRRMITHGHDAPMSANDLIGTPPRSRSVLFDLPSADDSDELLWIDKAREQGSLLFADVGFDGTGAWDPRVLDPLDRCHAFTPNVVESIDPTGAGDVFCAALSLGTLAGWRLDDRLAFAALCSALAVQQFGGSLAAPGWGDIADWWHAQRQSPSPTALHKAVLRRYSFLDDLVPDVPPSAVRRAAATIARRSDV